MTQSDEELLCGACGYNLRGITSSRCPECGLAFNANHLTTDLIPWEQRRHIGRARAFWRTVWLATFHPARLAEKVSMPVSLAMAKKFRRQVLWVAVPPLLAALVVLREFLIAFGRRSLYLIGITTDHKLLLEMFVLNPWSLAMTLLALTLWMICASVVGAYFFFPRSLSPAQQHRSFTVFHYATAPLTALPIALAMIGTGALLAIRLSYQSTVGAAIAYTTSVRLAQAGAATVVLIFFMWWLTTLRLMKLTTGASRRATIRFALLLLIIWFLLALAFLAAAHGLLLLAALWQATR